MIDLDILDSSPSLFDEFFLEVVVQPPATWAAFFVDDTLKMVPCVPEDYTLDVSRAQSEEFGSFRTHPSKPEVMMSLASRSRHPLVCLTPTYLTFDVKPQLLMSGDS